MHCSLGSSSTITLILHSLVFSRTCHQAWGRRVLTPVQHWRAVSVTSAELFPVRSVKKSSRISLNQSRRACTGTPCWCKIQCMVQLSSDPTPEGVTVISTASAVRCSLSAHGDAQGREHWLDFFAKKVVFVIISIVTGEKKKYSHKARDSYLHSKYEETEDKTRQ